MPRAVTYLLAKIMRVAGCYRAVRHKDHAVPKILPRSLLNKEDLLDIRIWRNHIPDITPMLLVNTPKRCGIAVYRNQFRRRVRMALLEVLKQSKLKYCLHCVIWVRPSKKVNKVQLLSFLDIKNQIRLAISRWESL